MQCAQTRHQTQLHAVGTAHSCTIAQLHFLTAGGISLQVLGCVSGTSHMCQLQACNKLLHAAQYDLTSLMETSTACQNGSQHPDSTAQLSAMTAACSLTQLCTASVLGLIPQSAFNCQLQNHLEQIINTRHVQDSNGRHALLGTKYLQGGKDRQQQQQQEAEGQWVGFATA